ncbi:MAG: VWA domain-containing protein [Sedimentisphaerales bacterium]|nr:VWA domain-containing protein [Sedimentisphaerales bacterium]
MKNSKKMVCLWLLILAVTLTSQVQAQELAVVTEQKPLIQMAILLDTSGSMSGLIDQARSELWAIVNEFIFAQKLGQVPDLQVALFEYGKSSISRDQGYIRMIVPFTTDLDKVSQELFVLKTNGGNEYCGWVIKEATNQLKWSNSSDDLKVIFIAGNEPFTQGPVDYRPACQAAISKGIVVNTIHCGREKDGLEGKWNNGALLADGKYLNINHNQKTIHIDAPQDNEIAELNEKLNDTYIAYGTMGGASRHRQAEQDLNATRLSRSAGLQRAVSKSSAYYKNEDWDLVDACKDGKVNLENIEAEELPQNMRDMTIAERTAYVESNTKTRTEIQQKIQQLNEQRKKYVAAEMKKQQKDTNTLGSAIIQAVTEQAKKKNYKIEPPQKPINIENEPNQP